MFQSPIHIGIDISDTSLKGVVLVIKNGHIHLTSHQTRSIPANIIEQGSIKNTSQLQKEIIELVKSLQDGKLQEHLITIPLPEPKTYLTLLPMPAQETSIADYLRAELPNHIPLSQEELAMDWQQVSIANKENQLLVATTDIKTIAEYTQLFQNSLLLPRAFEIESVAIQRAIFPIQPIPAKNTNLCCVVDLGQNRSGISLSQAGIPVLSVSVPFSGNHITELIAKELNLTAEQAEKAKQACGITPDKANGAIKKILGTMLDDLIHRLQETKTFFANHSGITEPWSRILLVGGGALLPGVDTYIQERAHITTTQANPLLNITPSDNLTQAEALVYTTAIGLALRGTLEQTGS